MKNRKIDRNKLISDRFPIENVADAFVTQGNGRAIKVMVCP